MSQTLAPSQTETCKGCPYFENYHESSGRGWCHAFDHQSREQHLKTNDCDQQVEVLEEQEATATQAEAQQELDQYIEAQSQEVVTYQQRQLLKQLAKLEGAFTQDYTVHQQRLGKLQREFGEDRQALTRQIVALKEALKGIEHPVLQQKELLLKSLKQFNGEMSSAYTVHQQRLGKLQSEFNEDRKALTRQIVALREAIQQLGGVDHG